MRKGRRTVVYSYFNKGCQKNVHVTIPKGIVGSPKFTDHVPDYLLGWSCALFSDYLF